MEGYPRVSRCNIREDISPMRIESDGFCRREATQQPGRTNAGQVESRQHDRIARLIRPVASMAPVVSDWWRVYNVTAINHDRRMHRAPSRRPTLWFLAVDETAGALVLAARVTSSIIAPATAAWYQKPPRLRIPTAYTKTSPT